MKRTKEEQEVFEAFSGLDEAMEKLESERPPPPKCHFTFMQYEWADDGDQQVEWMECVHCGHKKDMNGEAIKDE